MKFFAREKQTLEEHLTQTACMASEYADTFDLSYCASVVGLLHDLGKYTVQFQDYLDRSLKGLPTRRGEVIHALQGAKFIDETVDDKLIADILGNVIASHHSGLFDGISDGNRTLANKTDKSQEKLHYDEALHNFKPSIDAKKIKDEIVAVCRLCQQRNFDTPFMLHLVVKALFSCLVDADRCNSAGLSIDKSQPEWSSFSHAIGQFVSNFRSDSDISQIRQLLSSQCKAAGNRNPGVYTLSIPTGGGKTLSSLRFALEHAEKNNLERVIYVIPYLSILEQTAAELKKVFGDKADDIILEHHSNIDPPEDGEDENEYRLLCSRWDSPIVLTTMVQFLETIYSNKASMLRKFHNMAKSVVVFDEVQALPIKCTHLFNDAVNFLHHFGKSTILLCTATQPHLHETARRIRLTDNSELVHLTDNQLSVFSRTVIEDKSSSVSTFEGIADLAASQIQDGKSTLVILNTKKSAQKVYEKCAEIDCEKVFLTTDLCPAHRINLINHLRENLSPVTRKLTLCISTQLIEAGVDISFDCVIRSKAGLDSIIQAAGRCNRTGETRTPQPVYIVDVVGESLSRLPAIHRGKEITTRVIRENDGVHILSQAVMDTYYHYYYYDQKKVMDFDTTDGTTTVYGLLSKNPLGIETYTSRNRKSYSGLPAAFERASNEFAVIDSVQTGVVVQYGDANALISRFKETYDPSERMHILKKLQRYTVTVYENRIAQLKQEGVIDQVDDAFYLLSPDYYDAVLGLRLESTNSFLGV